MTARAIRNWYLVHKWTSLACTAFLLMLCITGLPLIFHHEIDELTRAPAMEQAAGGRASLDRVVANATARHLGQVPLYLSYDPDKPVIYASVAPSVTAPEDQVTFLLYDARSGAKIDAPPIDEGVVAFLLDLHAHLLLGIPGQLFLAAIGVVFLVALGSGVVVYAPFMRKLAFGTVRKDRTRRVKWLDTHNMIGIVTLGWVAVVGVTGFVITMTLPITMVWQMDELAEVSKSYDGAAPPHRLASIDAAVSTAQAAVPNGRLSFVAFPGTAFSTKHHYMIAFAGDTPVSERLIHPAFVDAATGQLSEVREMPWYVKTLFLSVPLHFGDYGGMPLKIVWALLDIAAIVVLGSGLYLWLGKRRASLDTRVAELTSSGLRKPAA